MTRKRKKVIALKKRYREVPRKHKFYSRRYCHWCGQSINIIKDNGHLHCEPGVDYWGEASEEHTRCRQCIDGYTKWMEAEMKKDESRWTQDGVLA